MAGTAGTIGEILAPQKISSKFFRKDSGFSKEDRRLLKHIYYYKNEDRTRGEFEELNIIQEVLDEEDVMLEDVFLLCLDKYNKTHRVESHVKVKGRIMTITCTPTPKVNKTLKKIGTMTSKRELAMPGSPDGTKHTIVDQSKANLDSQKPDDDNIPFEAEYSINLHEQYYSLVEDRQEYCFKFMDYEQNQLLLYPTSEDALLKWATKFKRQCVNTNLYECFDLEEMLYHSPSYNVE